MDRVDDEAIFLGAASYSIYFGHAFLTLFVSALLKYVVIGSAGDLLLIAATVLTTLISPLVEEPITMRLR